jgi:hypothetical protein
MRGPPGRNCRGHDRDSEYQCDYHGKGQYVCRRHTVQKGCQKASEYERRNHASGNAVQCDLQTLGEDHRKHSLSRRTHGHAQTNLISSLTHPVRHQTVDPNGREQYRGSGKSKEDLHGRTEAGDRAGQSRG